MNYIDKQKKITDFSAMTFAQFLSIVEIRTKIVSVSTFLISLLYVYLQGGQPDIAAILLFASVLMVDMGTTAFNSFFDFVKGVDHQSLNREKEKVLVHQKVPAGAALISALGLFAGAAAIGGYFIITRGWPVLLLGAASLVVGMLYSGGKRPISHTPLGELFAGGFLGSVLFIVVQYILMSEAAPRWGLWLLLSLPSALVIASILTVNNSCDLEADKAAGRRTLSIVIGRTASAGVVGVLIAAAFLLLAVLAMENLGGLHPLASLPALILLIPAMQRYRKMLAMGLIQKNKGPAMGGISAIFLLFSAAATSGQILSLIIAQ